MGKFKKGISYTVYGVIIACSAFVIAKNLIKLYQPYESVLIYETNHQEGEYTSKSEPLTTVVTSPVTYKVGDIPKGTVIEHIFLIKNTGDNPLVIYDIIPDCTCTDCSLSHKLVMPNEQTSITATVDTKNKNGIFIVNVIIRANSQEGAHRFSITGCVI